MQIALTEEEPSKGLSVETSWEKSMENTRDRYNTLKS